MCAASGHSSVARARGAWLLLTFPGCCCGAGVGVRCGGGGGVQL